MGTLTISCLGTWNKGLVRQSGLRLEAKHSICVSRPLCIRQGQPWLISMKNSLAEEQTHHSLLIAAFAKVQLPCFPVKASSIWFMARLMRPFAAKRSVLVVDAGVKADAPEATRKGAKVWKRILKE